MLKGVVWNIRGIMNISSMRRMKRLIKDNRLSFFVIIEPKAYSGNILDLHRYFSCSGSCSNSKDCIGFFWKRKINMQLLFESEQHVKMEMSHAMLSTSIMLSFV